MQWEHDEEEPEIQVFKSAKVPDEKRHIQGRSSSVQQHRRKELPVFEDTFTKRLGQRSKSTIRERTLERSNAFSRSTAAFPEPKRKSMDEKPRSSRNNEVVKVDKNCCRWPCTSDGVSAVPHDNENPKTPRSIGRQPAIRSHPAKEPRGLGALLSRKILRQNNNPVLYPAWEAEWALFREQHELEMKQMKEMYLGLQEMCQELKRMGSHRDDVSGTSSRRASVSESIDSRVDGAPLLGQSKRHGVLNYATIIGENGHHQPSRRAKSAPRNRVNWDTGLSKENSMHVRVPYGSSWFCPTAALFEEIVQVERFYLRNFVATLMKYGEERFQTDDSEFEQKIDSLRDIISRFLPQAIFAKPWHFKYGIEAWLSRIVFKEFGKASVSKAEGTASKRNLDDMTKKLKPRTHGLTYLQMQKQRGQDARARRKASWEEYQRLSLVSPVDAIDPNKKVYCGSFHVFCNRKFDAIQHELRWPEEWPDYLLTDFLEAMKHVWRAHKLALAFDPVASQFSVKTSAEFDVKFMEPLESPAILQNDILSPYTPHVSFLVNPGFIVLERIIKCQVYLAPDESMESP